MLPYFNIFGAQFSTYTICTLVGILVSGFYVCRTAKKRGQDDNDFIVFMIISAVGVLIGGHILYGITKYPIIVELITNWSKYVTNFEDFIGCLSVIFGGAVFYGGLLGGMVAGIIYGKIKKFDMNVFSDICAPMVPLFHCFGRIGCFLGGCCYGIESPIGFTVHNNELVYGLNDVNRFPVQLLEAGLNLLLFVALHYLLKNNKLKGKLFATYLICYAVIRFFDEFLRGDSYRGYWFGLSTSQLISIVIFVGAIIYIFIKSKKEQSKNSLQS